MQTDISCTKYNMKSLQVFSVLVETMDRFRRQLAPGERRVFFLATCPDAAALDPSLLQRGRLETVLLLGKLDASSRASILEIHARNMPLQLQIQLPPLPKVTPTLTSAPAAGNTAVGTEINHISLSESSLATQSAIVAEVDARGCSDSGIRPSCGASVEDDTDSVRNRQTPAPGATSLQTSDAAATALGVLPPPPPKTRKDFVALVAARCHGFLGSDLERLCREAAMRHMAAVASADTAIVATPTVGAIDCRRLAQTGTDDARLGDEAPDDDCQDERRARFTGGMDESGGVDGVGSAVRLQDFWSALDVVRPASLVGRSAGMWSGDSGGPQVHISSCGPCCIVFSISDVRGACLWVL